jgi:hypothetical protein
MIDPGENREDRNEAQKRGRREGQSTDTAQEELQIVQDPAFQRLAWKLQRFGWLVMLLSIGAAILGYLGPGLMTDSQAAESGTVRLEYNRFIHYGTPTRLRIHLKPTTHRKHDTDLWLSRRYLDRFQVQLVTPYPERVRAPLDGVLYTFAVGSNGDSIITFDLLPLYPGLLRGQLEASDERVNFNQFVLP